MELWLVRHAQTAWNKDDRYQGRTDIPLSAEGENEISDWTLPIEPDFIFASPQIRAKETAKKLFPQKDIKLDERLREMALGAWEGKTHDEVRAEYGELPNDGWYGLDYRVHGGETMREVMARLKPWLAEISELKAEKILAVSHKATITALFALATNWDYSFKPNPRIKFPAFHGFKLEKGGHISLLQINLPLKKEEIQ